MENRATRNQYDISPKVICSGKETAVCIRGLYPTMQFTNGETYKVHVFAPSTAFEDVAAAIKAGYSVAVEQVQGESLRIYGEHRFVKFAMFFAREVFPTHDKLCVREGDAMEEFIAKGDAVRLADYKGTITQYLKKTWGK